MPSGLFTIIAPISVVLLILKNKGPVVKFAQAGAVSAATARKPATIDVAGPDLLNLPGAVRRGILVSMNDGRYYVDVPVWKRKRRNLFIAVGVAGAILVTAAVLILGV